MTSILDAASATRASGSATQFQPFGDCEPYHDASDDYTRALCERVSDGAVHVVFARGLVHDIIARHNERVRLTAQQSAARKLAADESESDESRAEAGAVLETLAAAIDKLPKSRAVATVHVARALKFYSDTDAASNGADDPESESETDD